MPILGAVKVHSLDDNRLVTMCLNANLETFLPTLLKMDDLAMGNIPCLKMCFLLQIFNDIL